MERYKNYSPEQNQLLPVDTLRMFPKGSFERFLVNILNKIEVDLYFKNGDKGGETPYDPRALLGIIFYGYSKGIYFSRQLESACCTDIGFMFVSGFCTPDHSTISRFININKDLAKEVFTKVLYLADESGYIDYKFIAVDGTKIKANASSDFSGTLESFKKRKKRIEEKIELAIRRQKETDKKAEEIYWKKKEERYKENMSKIEVFLSDAKEIRNYYNKEIQQNITDKDCRRMKLNGGISESYNSQISVCGKKGVIIASDVSNCETDYNLFTEQLDNIINTIPDDRKEEIKKSKLLFDSGYFKIDNVIEADKRDINVYIASKSNKYIFGYKEKEKKNISTNDCKIKKYKGFYSITCPGGILLTEYKIQKCKDDSFYAFKVNADKMKVCEKCIHYDLCRGKNKNNRTKTFRILKQNLDNLDIIKKHSMKFKTDSGKMIYSRRMPIVETVFAQIKERFRFRRFLRRGLEKVRNEWYWICTAYNIKRLSLCR